MRTSTAAKRFTGVWRLEAIRDRFPDGRTANHPDFGTEVDGFLVYTSSGHVFVQFMRKSRTPWRNEETPTAPERAAACRGYGAYAGRFEVDERAGVVRHHVEVALIPNRIGCTLTRSFSFEGDRLDLSPPPFSRGGRKARRTLTWRRVG